MLCFFKGIELSTPINSSVLITVTPILVFVFSRILIKEKFVAKRIWGVVLGFIGAVSYTHLRAHETKSYLV